MFDPERKSWNTWSFSRMLRTTFWTEEYSQIGIWPWLLQMYYSKTCLQGTLRWEEKPVTRGHFLRTLSYLPHVEPATKGHLSCRDTFSSDIEVSLEDRFYCSIKSLHNVQAGLQGHVSHYLSELVKYSFYGILLPFSIYLHDAILRQVSDQIYLSQPNFHLYRASMRQVKITNIFCEISPVKMNGHNFISQLANGYLQSNFANKICHMWHRVSQNAAKWLFGSPKSLVARKMAWGKNSQL